MVAAAAGGPRPSPATLLAAPASRRGRALRATGLLAVAALAVQFPELVLHTGLVAIAAGLVYVAAGDLLRVVAPPSCAARRLRAAALAAALLGLIAVVTRAGGLGRGGLERRDDAELAQQRERVPVQRALDHHPVLVERRDHGARSSPSSGRSAGRRGTRRGGCR